MAGASYEQEVSNTQVTIMAGGQAKRMNNEIKSLLLINGVPLIERTLRQYYECGFRTFNILAGFGHEKIEDYLKNDSKYAKGVGLRTSIDDPSWVAAGKGKALKLAIENGVIDRKKRSIIVHPDDVFFSDSVPEQVLKGHLEKGSGYKATIVTTSGTEYPYGEIVVDSKGTVEKFIAKPFVKKFTHTGISVVEPEAYGEIDRLIDLNSNTAQEFEKVVLEKLASERKVANFTIEPYDVWMSVNTLKEYETAKARLEK
ncbi:MAG: NTP transferase domain-containing protein [Candidatus Micrarchaeota archaeon]|nr:NTP transferase domain-containing protein [Candidatus Micrarchaeota archaeon]MDE1846836.1 NTP transferase domain-containing protein [Candidatus Micrarchaeota archaeon]